MNRHLIRRTNEHGTKYNKIDGCQLKLKYYSYIDPLYITTTEKEIKNIIDNFNLKMSFNNEKELIIIPFKYRTEFLIVMIILVKNILIK